MVTVHAPVPEHPPPDHPANVEPVLADAVKVTFVPTANSALQPAPGMVHWIPGGDDVTVPCPVPVGVISSNISLVKEADTV
jgi:hypothetical protein